MVTLMSVSLVAVATAHVSKVNSNITFNVDRNGPDQGDSTLEGRVRSHRHVCESFRQVEFYRVNDFNSGADTFVIGTVTNENGRYSFPPGGSPIAAGRYYAVAVREVVVTGPGHHHVCRKAVSGEEVVLGGPSPRR